jgi:predicted RNase H-like nuclease (RuvC/YqgF family)
MSTTALGNQFAEIITEKHEEVLNLRLQITRLKDENKQLLNIVEDVRSELAAAETQLMCWRKRALH